MAGDGKRRRTLLRSVILLLFSLTPSLNCFSLTGLRKNVHQEKLVSEAAVTNGRMGHIVFNGKANVPSRSSSGAEDRSGLAHVDLPQADEPLGQTSQLETAQEAAWRRLNPTLSCGATKMKLKAMGPGAADLQLDMGLHNGIERTLPLIRVPRSCGYSMRQNALGLVLVVPYDGCGVFQENGNHVLPMSWLQNPVKLACPSQSADATPLPPTTTTSTPPLPTPINPPLYPNSPYFPYMSSYPPFGWPQQWQYAVPPATTAPTTTTTAEPVTIPTTTVSTTESPPPVPLNYPSFPYPPFYPPFGWPQPTVAPVSSPVSTNTVPTTNAAPAVNPPVANPYPYYQYPYYVWYASDPGSNLPAATTTPPTTAGPTTGTPTQPSTQPPNYPNYQYYPAGVPSQPGLYYPFIQPQYPPNLNPPTGCSMQSDASASTTCPNKMPSSSSDLDLSPYYPYSWFPFLQYMWHKNKHFPYSWKYRSPAGYLPGIQTLIQPYPGFQYQQPMPWFPYVGQ